MDNIENIKEEFGRLLEIMETLRGDDGCPWDREQTFESLRQYLLEETYEVLELIDEGRFDELKNELGDLLLQVIFQSQIASEENRFNIEDVIRVINGKLIHRHPNVFGDVEIKNAEEQTVNWEKMKRKEGKKSVIDGVPTALSSLLRAHRLQGKASTVGFDWNSIEPVWDKLYEEIEELKKAISSAERDKIEEEFGDVLFSMVNLSRFIKVNPEDALRIAIKKFIRRFHGVENRLASQGKKIHETSLEEMDEIWNDLKNEI
ncbi:MAG: nucleoside triphosphate pyrophosphohydrolase [candidate division KSB1 bacterium]|jgi:MazG family protein|nr:nucleoside triphosphate pyrophosphohydrolase [candidate division KSB1 bacterium]